MLQKYQAHKTFHSEFSNIETLQSRIPIYKYEIPDSCIPSEYRPNPRYRYMFHLCCIQIILLIVVLYIYY